MSAPEYPQPGATAQQVIAFLSHQLGETVKHIQAHDATEAQISARFQAMAHAEVESIRRSADEKIRGFEQDARRFHAICQFITDAEAKARFIALVDGMVEAMRKGEQQPTQIHHFGASK